MAAAADIDVGARSKLAASSSRSQLIRTMTVDTALKRREAEDRPIRVALIGAGATGRAIALQLGTPVPGIRLAGIANRTARNAERAFRESGIERWATADSPDRATDAIRRGVPVLTDDPSVLIRSTEIDIVLEVTGTV